MRQQLPKSNSPSWQNLEELSSTSCSSLASQTGGFMVLWSSRPCHSQVDVALHWNALKLALCSATLLHPAFTSRSCTEGTVSILTLVISELYSFILKSSTRFLKPHIYLQCSLLSKGTETFERYNPWGKTVSVHYIHITGKYS